MTAADRAKVAEVLAEMRARCEVTESGCWEWGGHRNKAGYGSVNRGNKAHRVSYSLVNGLIPDDHEIDHLCNNPPCINPEHLEAVTRLQHARRTADRRGAADVQRRAAEMRLAGMSYQEIADALGFKAKASAWCAVNRAIRRDFVSADELPRQAKLTIEQRRAVAELYASGVTTLELAEQFGVDRSYIYKLAKGISRSARRNAS
jgi:hypothetical protein